MLPFPYGTVLAQFTSVRQWAGYVTQGDRCALVMGLTLRLRPGPGDKTFRGLSAASADVRNQPVLDNMFVKANDVAMQILRTYGPQTLFLTGGNAPSNLNGLSGVVYLENCWKTRWGHVTGVKSGDHIDLWDGNVIEIYRNEPQLAVALVRNAERVWFWQCQ